MAHQVFVSYATEDADTAERVCALLEADGIVCWMAPRDVEAGTDYAAAIMDAIRNSQLVVLVFSAFSNASPYALREIERAVAYQRPVLALRTDDTVPNSSIEYYVNVWQKLKAAAEVEKKQEEIVAAVRDAIRASKVAGQPQTGVPRKAVKMRRWARRRWWIIAAAAIVLVAAAAAGGTWAATHAGGDKASAVVVQKSNTWIDLSPSGTPKRTGQDMVYDPSSGRLIMFGGLSGAHISDVKNDTWTYDPVANTWTELKPSGTLPSARVAPSMEYDPSTRRVIMFGGRRGSTRLNDTWAYDPAANAWTELSPAGTLPSGRGGHDMVYDPSSGRLIMFGGLSGVGDESTEVLNDTWAYDPTVNAWTNLAPGGTLPPARCLHSLAYDPTSRRLVMFGGWDDPATPGRNDTWAYDPSANTWTELSPSGTLPSGRNGASLVYDSSNGLMIMFGGGYNDTWAYDPGANTWAELSPVGARPSPRYQQSMVFHPSTGMAIMFGGGVDDLTQLGDTWAYTL